MIGRSRPARPSRLNVSTKQGQQISKLEMKPRGLNTPASRISHEDGWGDLPKIILAPKSITAPHEDHNIGHREAIRCNGL